MKIKAKITIPENNSLENERGVFTITYDSEIEIDDAEIDRMIIETRKRHRREEWNLLHDNQG